jgi:hypothetical protein
VNEQIIGEILTEICDIIDLTTTDISGTYEQLEKIITTLESDYKNLSHCDCQSLAITRKSADICLDDYARQLAQQAVMVKVLQQQIAKLDVYE